MYFHNTSQFKQVWICFKFNFLVVFVNFFVNCCQIFFEKFFNICNGQYFDIQKHILLLRMKFYPTWDLFPLNVFANIVWYLLFNKKVVCFLSTVVWSCCFSELHLTLQLENRTKWHFKRYHMIFVATLSFQRSTVGAKWYFISMQFLDIFTSFGFKVYGTLLLANSCAKKPFILILFTLLFSTVTSVLRSIS